MNRTRIVVLLLAVGSSTLMSATMSAAVFIGLGDLAGGDFHSEAHAISADGSTVVGYSKYSGTDGLVSINNADQAFRWSLGTGMVGLGNLTGGTYASQANGVSGDGAVIVGVSGSTPGDQAFRWSSIGGMSGIGDLTGGTFFSQANDISADGNRIVGVSESSNGAEAFQYTFGSGLLGLGDLPGDTFRSTANAVSDNGLVIVGQSDSDLSETYTAQNISFDEAFRQSVFGSMTGLGVEDDSSTICDCVGSGATAVSADGSIVVGWTSSTFLLPIHTAFRWTAADGMELLDIPFSDSTVPNDISADGSVVVGAYGTLTSSSGSLVIFPDDPHEAFIWTASEGVINFQQLLEVDYGLDLSGWTLESATGVSADGSVITGYGINPAGNREAWVVALNTVPEPSSVVLGLLAGLVVAPGHLSRLRRW